MKKRDSTFRSDVPILVGYYQKASDNVFGNSPFVHQKSFKRFTFMEDKLRSLSIAPRDYADTVTAVLKKWALDKNLDHVPVHIFVSDYALNKYIKIAASESVNVVDEDGEIILLNELLVLRTYIHRNLTEGVVRFGDVVNDIRSIVSKDWLTVYEQKTRPTAKALEILSEEFGAKYANSVNDILIVARRHNHG